MLKPSYSNYYLEKIKSFYSDGVYNLNELLRQTLLLSATSVTCNDKQMQTYNKISMSQEFIELFNQGKLSRLNLVMKLDIIIIMKLNANWIFSIFF